MCARTCMCVASRGEFISHKRRMNIPRGGGRSTGLAPVQALLSAIPPLRIKCTICMHIILDTGFHYKSSQNEAMPFQSGRSSSNVTASLPKPTVAGPNNKHAQVDRLMINQMHLRCIAVARQFANCNGDYKICSDQKACSY